MMGPVDVILLVLVMSVPLEDGKTGVDIVQQHKVYDSMDSCISDGKAAQADSTLVKGYFCLHDVIAEGQPT
jgi:hypothetical protein